MINVNPLFDNDFLIQLLESQEREIYARITALTQNEMPIEYIEGRATGGSINIDGASAMRRTCSLNMVAQEVNINEFYWGLKNKFKLEVGLKNNINPIYPDIIWFKLGLFVITAFNTTLSTNNWSISINGKDKMCLLNGEISGSLPHTTDFGLEENYNKENDTVTYRNIPIKEIIRESVLNFGNELPSNIIINDIEDSGLELLEYKGDTPLYMFREINSLQFKNITFNPNLTCYYYLDTYISGDRYRAFENDYSKDDVDLYYIKINDNLYLLRENEKHLFKGKISDEYLLYDNLVKDLDGESESTTITLIPPGDNVKFYKIAKFEYGSTPGYRMTDLVYAGELICNAGETLTSMLDKIVSMLGDFEYFYNIDGKFVFLKKQKNIVFPWNQNEEDNEPYSDANINNSVYTYSFLNSHLINSFLNSPNLLNLRNDYSIWGTAKRNEVEFPIHLRYAIDHKPESYTTIPWYNIDGSIKKESKNYSIQEYDWRELIYQMALDYRQNYHNDNFLSEIVLYNYPNYSTGKTGYELYYIDLEGYWREVYDPNPEMLYNIIKYENILRYKDSLYILHAYRKIQEEDLTINMDLKQVFVLENGLLFPYLGSKYCHLVKGDEYFYITKNNTLAWSNNEAVLNLIDFDKIYIKGRCLFNTIKLDDNDKETYEAISLTKYTFESNRYYFKDEKLQYKLAATYYDGVLYYKKNMENFYTMYHERVEVDNNNFIPNKYYIYDSEKDEYILMEIYNPDIKDYYVFEPYLVYENAKVELPFAEIDKRDYTLYAMLYHPTLLNDDIKNKLYIKDYNYTKYALSDKFDNTIFTFYQNNAIEGNIKITDTNIICPSLLNIVLLTNYNDYLDTIIENVNYAYGYYNYNHNENNDGNYWSKTITDNPELLNFWFDFIECEGSDIMKYAVPTVGSRTKVVNDKDIKTIYYKEVPTTIFITLEQKNSYEVLPGYTYILLQNTMLNLFTISSLGKSAKEVLDNLLYQHSYCIETTTLSVIPVYHLLPNYKIYIRDEQSGVEGEYIIDKLTIPLTYNGMMSITAKKLISNLI